MHLDTIKKVKVNISLSFLKSLAARISGKFKLSNQTVSLVFVSSREIKKLNKIYRGKDLATDVLSFSYDTVTLLGEIIICAAQARQQARDKKISFRDEVSILFIHGCLHLLGFNHDTDAKARQMEQMERKLLYH